jgi:putative SOS response-associated peptidase YedK
MELAMCNRYTIRGTAAELIEHFDATLPMPFDLPTEDVVPGHLAPGLLLNGDRERELVPMQFGLAKPGAADSFDRKWPNNNARIEKYGKWPWKVPFQRYRYVVPLSKFREACYCGETAGRLNCGGVRRTLTQQIEKN